MAKELDSAGLKVIQLECIIAAKDKEISLLREQLSQDQGVGGTVGSRRHAVQFLCADPEP
jgi:hypothetical protein